MKPNPKRPKNISELTDIRSINTSIGDWFRLC